MEADGRCKLDLMLVREVFDDSEAKIWYPVNQLRNYARLQVSGDGCMGVSRGGFLGGLAGVTPLGKVFLWDCRSLT